MKILHVSHGCLPDMSGGIETYLDVVLREQARQGLEVELLAGSHELREQTTIESAVHDGIPTHRLYRSDLYFDLWSKAYSPGAEQEFDALLDRVRPDIVHVHQWIRLTNNLVEIAAHHGIAAVVTTHDVYTSCPRCFRVRRDGSSCERPLSVASCLDCVPRFGHETEPELRHGIELYADQMRAELAMAAKVLVADPATRDLIVATTAIPAERFDVLPLPYERRFGPAPVTARVPAADEPVRFAYWGVLTERKGAQILAEAFRELCDAGLSRPAELHLFGGIDTPELERQLRSITGGTPTFFHGRYEYEQLENAELHAGIFPMLCFETWGFVLDECIELGLPCISSDNGALSRRAGGSALVVPQHDVTAMRHALARIVERPALLAELHAALPALPPTVEEHARILAEIYAAAQTTGPTPAPAIDATRRAHALALQRESALGRAIGPDGPR